MPAKLEMPEVRLSHFRRDFSHVLILLKLWFFKIRECINVIFEKLKISNLREIKAKLEEQPIIVCFTTLAKFVAYVGGLWLKSL